MAIIEVENLSKQYGDFTAVNGISFKVKEGEIFGFLGPNGAGKTTTINMLTGLSRISSGSIRIKGIDTSREMKKVQQLTGVVPGESNLYPELSGFENLCFCASLYGVKKKEREREAERLLEEFGLRDFADKPFGTYSKGMRRRLTIAAGIIHKPGILFLDEPTTGIDVVSARQIRQLLIDLNRKGTTIFLTTHYIEEAERLCDRIAFIVKGKIKHIDRIDRLLDNTRKGSILEFLTEGEGPENRDRLNAALSDYRVELSGNRIRIYTEEQIGLKDLIDIFYQQGCNIYEARLLRPSLEDVFVEITGIEAAEMKKDKENGGR